MQRRLVPAVRAPARRGRGVPGFRCWRRAPFRLEKIRVVRARGLVDRLLSKWKASAYTLPE
jgi:hypothetical protein